MYPKCGEASDLGKGRANWSPSGPRAKGGAVLVGITARRAWLSQTHQAMWGTELWAPFSTKDTG